MALCVRIIANTCTICIYFDKNPNFPWLPYCYLRLSAFYSCISPLVNSTVVFRAKQAYFCNMSKSAIRYWACQLIGWGTWTSIQLFIAYVYAPEFYLTPDEKRKVFLIAIFIEFAWCVAATHVLRLILKRFNWIRLPIGRVVLLFIVGVGLTSIGLNYGAKFTAKITNSSFDQYMINERRGKALRMEAEMGLKTSNYVIFKKLAEGDSAAYKEAIRLSSKSSTHDFEINNLTITDTAARLAASEAGDIHKPDYYTGALLAAGDSSDFKDALKIRKSTGWMRDAKGEWAYEEQSKGREFWNILITLILISLWLLIYLVWHYIEKNRKDQLDNLKLESLVKELELKTIKSHINPHFIFNALNSIRALVDENPIRARTAITELSNILRSSMQAEKLETVPLHRELDIVKDYLALEQMRFEERLQVKMDIDEDTLDQPIPPMMLQTLVENAIKHGISKYVNGGTVTITSDFKDNHHELIVRNSGQLNGKINGDGFGIKSTQDRLNLLYQGKASFAIRNFGNNMVESKIIMPVAIEIADV
jgi:Histidine kinase